MGARTIGFILGASLLTSAAVPAWADESSFRCGNRLVTPGTIPAQVRALCGEPKLIDHRAISVPICDRSARCSGVRTADVEEWTYQREGELMRILRFVGGALVSIRTGPQRPSDPDRCQKQTFRTDATAGEVLLACGEPIQIDRWVEPVAFPRHPGTTVAVAPEFVWEQWVYNFGPDRFLRIFQFENGVLRTQTTGRYGF
jgi:hypothetical protein